MESIPPELEGILVRTPETLPGAVRFEGTRVFAYQLFDYVLSGQRLETFLDDFPGVHLVQAEAVLAWERARLHRELEAAP
ncbi:MAG: DUF433 domain-containing protein [Fimbriimonadaceae bacterium]